MRQSVDHGIPHVRGGATTLVRLGCCRLVLLARISELPGVFGQGGRPIHQRLEARIDGETLLAQLFEAMRLSKRDVVPRQECFEGLFNRLLAVEQYVAD
jgi:hypothetical protein